MMNNESMLFEVADYSNINMLYDTEEMTVITPIKFYDHTFFDSVQIIIYLLFFICLAIIIGTIFFKIIKHIKLKSNLKNILLINFIFFIISVIIENKINGLDDFSTIISIHRDSIFQTILSLNVFFFIGYLNVTNKKINQILSLIFICIVGLRKSFSVFSNLKYNVYITNPVLYIFLYFILAIAISEIIGTVLYICNKKLISNSNSEKKENSLRIISQIILLIFIFFK